MIFSWYFPYDLIIDSAIHAYRISIRLLVDQLLNPFPRRCFHIIAHTSYEYTVHAPSCLFRLSNHIFSHWFDRLRLASRPQHLLHIFHIIWNEVFALFSPLAGDVVMVLTFSNWRGLCHVLFLPNAWQGSVVLGLSLMHEFSARDHPR